MYKKQLSLLNGSNYSYVHGIGSNDRPVVLLHKGWLRRLISWAQTQIKHKISRWKYLELMTYKRFCLHGQIVIKYKLKKIEGAIQSSSWKGNTVPTTEIKQKQIFSRQVFRLLLAWISIMLLQSPNCPRHCHCTLRWSSLKASLPMEAGYQGSCSVVKISPT